MRKKIGCSMIFHNDIGQILLQLRDDIPTIKYPGMWDLPGGGVEEGEKPEEAIVREMKEELDLDLGKPELFRVTEFFDRTDHTFHQKFNIPDTELNKKLTEGQCVKWFSEEAAKKITLAFEFAIVVEAFFTNRKI